MVKTTWYEITRRMGNLTAMKRANNKSYNTPYVVQLKDFGQKTNTKTTDCNICIYTNGLHEPLSFNGWNLTKPIQVAKRNWSNSVGKHYFVEIFIESSIVGNHEIKLFTPYDEEKMIICVMETLGLLFMSKDIVNFRSTLNMITEGNVIDWRKHMAGDILWRFSKTINTMEILPNPFSSALYK